jgi:hypothetical protein
MDDLLPFRSAARFLPTHPLGVVMQAACWRGHGRSDEGIKERDWARTQTVPAVVVIVLTSRLMKVI